MDQNLLPPLPSVEELFAPSTSQSSSLPFLKNVSLFGPTLPLPPSPSATNVPPMPPHSPPSENTEPFSPQPPQPTSPLVDQFDIQPEGNKTSDSVLQLENNKRAVSSSKEELQGSPPSKKVRFSETAEDDSHEEGEISDDSDDDVAVRATKLTALNHKPPSSSHTVHRSEQTRQSVSHGGVPTEFSVNSTRMSQSSSRHHHQSRASDITERSSSHHRSQRDHRHSSSKDASKSSHHRHHRVDGTSAYKSDRSSLSLKKSTAHSDERKQPDYDKRNHGDKSSSKIDTVTTSVPCSGLASNTARNRGITSTSSIDSSAPAVFSSHHHSSCDRVAGTESAESESRSSSHYDGPKSSYSVVDTCKFSMDMDAPYSPGSLDLDHLFDLASDLQEAILQEDKASSKVNTVTASVPCLGLASNTAKNGEVTKTDIRDHSATSVLSSMNVGNQNQKAVSYHNNTSSKIETVSASVPCSAISSNMAQNTEITNKNIEDSPATSVLTATNVEHRFCDSAVAYDLQKAVSHHDKTSSVTNSMTTSIPCLGLASNTAKNKEVTNVNIGEPSATSILTVVNVANQKAVSCRDKASIKTRIDAVNASVPSSAVSSNVVQNSAVTTKNVGSSSATSVLTATNVEHRFSDFAVAANRQKAVSHPDITKTSSKVGTLSSSVPCSGLLADTAQNREITNMNIGDCTIASALMAMNVGNRLFNPGLASDLLQAILRGNKNSGNIDTTTSGALCSGLSSNMAQNTEVTNANVEDVAITSDLGASSVDDLVMEIDTSDRAEELPAAEEAEVTAESAAADGVGQEYEIIDDLESNVDEVDNDADASSNNSDMELDSDGEEEEISSDKHIKTQHSQRFKEAARASQRRWNNTEPFDEDGDDDFEAPLVNNKIVLRGESETVFSWYIDTVGWVIIGSESY